MVVFRTIRSKLIVGIVSLLVIMAVSLTLVATQRTQAALRDQIEETHVAHAERIAGELDRRMADAMAFADAAARNDLFRQPVPDEMRGENGSVPPDEGTARRAFLDQLLATVDLFGAGALVDPDGTVVLAEPIEAQWRLVEETAAHGEVSRIEVLARSAEGMDEPFIQRGLHPGSWVAVVPLQDLEDDPLGVLLFEGRNAPLVAFAQDAVDGAGTALFIVDDQGRVLAGPPPSAAGQDLSAAMDQLEREQDHSTLLAIGNERYLATLFPLSTTSWHLVLATDTDTAFGAVQTILRTTVLLGAIALIFGVAMSLVLAQGISIPVRRLTTAAERVTAGEYGTQVRVATRDELADLAGAFNAMSARLQEENQRLMQYQESLEETVEARTLALREKNDELEAFVYAASHDLRTPIISLDWLVQELEEQLQAGADGPAAVAETVGRIRANIDGMDRLVHDLLELSRIGRTEGEPTAVPVRAVVDDEIRSLHPRLSERDVTVEVEVPAEAVVLADRRRMQQVFANLLANAIKYGPDTGGTIRVRAAPVGTPERPWKWRFEVTDEGPGVPPEHRERIFMLFQRAPDPLGRPIEGTGVGLAMVRKIILAYGGQIHVTDAPRGGALFWFTLPAPRDQRGSVFPAAPPQRSRTPPSASKARGLPSNPDEQPDLYGDAPSEGQRRPD